MIFAILAFLSLPLLTGAPPESTDLFINEFMASNTGVVTDPDFGETGDWIEVFNAGSSPVDMSGYILTDDPELPSKWVVPFGTTIPAGGYLVFWADDHNTGFHTNFKLSSTGEWIALKDASGAIVDSLTFGEQVTDQSYGRTPDGGITWLFFDEVTPGAANASTGAHEVAPAPVVSLASGFYAGTMTMSMSTSLQDGQIRYTLDGAAPTTSSPLYTTPIEVESTAVVRAATFKDGFVPSLPVTRSYFINDASDLPVFSIVTDPAYFFDDEIGIYVEGTNGTNGNCADGPRNWNQDWEHPINIEMFESDGTSVFSQDAGVQIFGGCSRLYAQKSLSIHARKRYGDGDFDYALFADKDIDEYDSFNLRNSGQDWFRTMFRDGLIHTLIAANTDIPYEAFRPAVVFLNGAYWGIHNIREKLNSDYIKRNFGYEETEIDFLKGRLEIVTGSSNHYQTLIDFVETNDLSVEANMDQVRQWMDVEQYLDYQAVEIYMANGDWPSGNIKYWRPNTPDGRWQWLLFDTDFAFGGNTLGKFFANMLAQATATDGPDWPNPPWSTLLFRRLLENEGFRHDFIQRSAAHMETTFEPTRIQSTIDSLVTLMAPEVPRHEERWPESIGFNTPWEIHIDVLEEFAVERPSYARDHMAQYFGLSGMKTLAIENNQIGRGQILVAGVRAYQPSFEGFFFQDIPMTLTAIPDEGYHFIGWSGDVQSANPSIVVDMQTDLSLTAMFGEGLSHEREGPETQRTLLEQNFPNPFQRATTIYYELGQAMPVTMRLYDVVGREVRQWTYAMQPAGRHSIRIDAEQLAGGAYFYVLETPAGIERKTMMLIR